MTSDAAASAAAGRSPVAELLQVPAVPQGGDGLAVEESGYHAGGQDRGGNDHAGARGYG